MSRPVGLYDEHILPRIIDLTCGMSALAAARERTAAGLRGDVLEIGFGSGLNVPHYPSRVTRVFGVDPSGGAKRLAQKRLARSPCPVEFVGLYAETVDLPDASVDSALCTFTLCTIEDVASALAEVRRILKPAGTFHFLEHGRAPDPSVARWQHRLNPLQKAIAGGCNLNRDIPALVRDAGFTIESLETGYAPEVRGPRTHTYLYAGVAAK
jgi:ubiquinone/menaquinone biosynthesis C-methylase UbiE